MKMLFNNPVNAIPANTPAPRQIHVSSSTGKAIPPGIRDLLDHYLLNPWAAIGGSLTLLFPTPLMDILPMYILFACADILA
jgi:hypothetical protein